MYASMYPSMPMQAAAFAGPSTAGAHPLTILQRLALALVWLSIALSAVVFTEPAPVDVLVLGLVIGLPLVGLVAVPGPLWILGSLWFVCGAGAVLASSFAPDIAKSARHTAISLYLYAFFFVFAGFIAKRPLQHTRLILDAYMWASLIGAAAGVAGYFNLFPGAFDLFTRFGRATGTFKDPNVFGPFLVPALLWALHKVLNEPIRRTLLPGAAMLFLSFALLLSFSRGAWLNAAIAILVYIFCSLVFATTNRHRIKMLLLGTLALGTAVFALTAAAQTDAVGDLLRERAALTQSYDVGPEGRFGGQQKAKALILEHPLGLGAQVFAPHYHHEEPHNAYLNMFLNAGWVGGFIFAALVGLTSVWGLWHATRRTATQPMFFVVIAAFLGNAVEGFVIDLDHWRHFYLQMAIIWGLMLAADTPRGQLVGMLAGRVPRALRPGRIVGHASGRIVRALPQAV
jgi:hypothetical protein